MSRETTDILYIDLDYYTPENYYVYTAEASVVAEGYITDDYFVYDYFETDGSVASLTCELTQVVGQTVTGSGTLSSSASLSVSVAVTRSTSATLNSSFTQTASGEKTLEISATLNANFTQTSSGEVTRGFGAGLNASASITCSNYRIRPGDVDLSGAFNASITCVATKTGDILLQSQFTQSTAGSRTRTTDSTLNAQASQSATAGRLLESTATLNSSATLSATALNLQLADATLASSAGLTADGFVSNRRPRQYVLYNSPSFVTGKFNQALRVGYNGSVAQYLEWYDSDAWKTWRTMSFWVKPISGFALNGVQCQIYAHNSGGLDDYFRVALQRSTAITNGYKIIINQRSSSTNYSYSSAAFALTDFSHIRIVRHASGFDVWIDGSLDTPVSDTTIDTLPNVATAPILGQDYTSSYAATVAIDEFWLTTDTVTSAGTSSFTVPTTRTLLTQAEQNNTIVLQHMDNDADDDLNIVERADATLSSSATLASDVSRTRTASSTMNSASTLSVDGIKIHSSAASTMNVTATLLTAVGEIEEFIIFAQNFATLSATIGTLESASATLNSAATLTADGQDFDFAEASLTSAFGITASIEKRFRPKGYVEWDNNYGIDIDPYNTFPLEGMLYFGSAGSPPTSYKKQAIAYSDDSVFGEYGKQILNATDWTIEFIIDPDIVYQGSGGIMVGIDGYFYMDLTASGSITSEIETYFNGTTISTGTMNDTNNGTIGAGKNYIALVKEGTQLRLYIGGRGNLTGNLYQKWYTTVSTPTVTSNLPFNLGGYTSGSTFNGPMSNLRFDAIKFSLSAKYSGNLIEDAWQHDEFDFNRNLDDELIYFNFDNSTLGVFEFNNFDTNAPTLDEQSIGSNGIKNASATLNSQFSAVGTITGPQRLPATTISSQATMSVEGNVTVEGVSTLNSSATLSVPEIDVIQFVAASLNANATLTASIARTRPASATLNASTSLTASAGAIRNFSTYYAGNRTAKTVTVYGDAAISTAQAKFGSGSALITDTGDYFTISGDSDLYNGDFSVEMWVWATNLTQMPNGTIWDNRTSSSSGFLLYVSYGSIGLYEGINLKGLTSAGFNNSQWNHIAVVRNGTNIKVFVNGVQKISATVTTTNYSNRTTYIGSTYTGSVPFRAYIDEVRLSTDVRYSTNFTPSTSSFNDDADTGALLHLDSNFDDDIDFFNGIAVETSLFAASQTFETTTATLNTAVTMSASADRTRSTGSTQPVVADISANANKTTDTGATLNSSATQTVTGTRIQQGVVDISGAFNATMTVNAILRPLVYLSTAVTASIDPVKTAVTGATLDSSASLEVETLKVVGFEASTSAQFGITIDNQVIKAVGADLDAAFTQSTNTDNSKTAGFEAQLDSAFAQTVTVNRTRPGDATLNVGTAMVTGGARFVGVDSTMNSSTTLSVIGGKIADGQATLLGFFSTLTAGDVINIDPFRTLTVSQETRVVRVLAENRTVIVDQETRVNTLL